MTTTDVRTWPVKRALLAGLLAGTLDGGAAVMQYWLKTGKDPANVFIYIASGVFGQSAFSGGRPMALWGVVFHYCIALAWASFYATVAHRIPRLPSSTVVRAVLYGCFIWAVMNLVVLPLSAVPPIAMAFNRALTAAAILVVCVGAPIVALLGPDAGPAKGPEESVR